MPPPPPPQNLRQKKNNTAVILIIVGVCVLVPCVGLVIAGVFGWSFLKNTAFPLASCAVNFEEVQKSVLQYAKEHDGKFPKADQWQDEVKEYFARSIEKSGIQNSPIPVMDPNGDWGCKGQGGAAGTGMAFNSDLSEKKLASVKDPEDTVMVYEIPSPSRNAHASYAPPTQSGPLFMGTHRHWIKEFVKRTANNSSDSFNFQGSSSSSDSSEDSSKSSDDSATSKSSGAGKGATAGNGD